MDDFVAFVLVGWIPGLFGAIFGRLEYKMVRKDSPHVWILPVCTGIWALICLICTVSVSGWDVLGWYFCLVFAAAAFLGTLIGCWLAWRKNEEEEEK